MERLTDEAIAEIYNDIQTWVESDVNNIDRVDLLSAMLELIEDNAALIADNARLRERGPIDWREGRPPDELKDGRDVLIERWTGPGELRRMVVNYDAAIDIWMDGAYGVRTDPITRHCPVTT